MGFLVMLKILFKRRSTLKFRFCGLWACLSLASVCIARPHSHPAKNTNTYSSSSKSIYTVTDVDNDYTIARKFGITLSKLHQLNSNVNWNRLRPGLKLIISSNHSSSSSSSIPHKARTILKTGQVEITKDNVIVRSRPNIGGTKLTMAEKGERASLLSKEKGWSKLHLKNGEIGWVRNDMVKGGLSSSAVAIAQKKTSSTRHKSSYHAQKGKNSSPSNGRLAYHTGDNSVVDSARSYLGVRYRWTGMSRSGVDCSGLTTKVYQRHGVHLPHSSRSQAHTGIAVKKSELKAGDLVFFKTRGRRVINHVGIFIGNGKFIHASSGKGRVRVDTLTDGYYSSRYAGGRRVKRNISAPKKKDFEEELSKLQSEEE